METTVSETRVAKLLDEVRREFDENLEKYEAICERKGNSVSQNRSEAYLDGYTTALDWILVELEGLFILPPVDCEVEDCGEEVA